MGNVTKLPTRARAVLSVPASPARRGARMLGREIIGLADRMASDIESHADERLGSIAAALFMRQSSAMVRGAFAIGLIGLIGRSDLERLLEQEMLRLDGYIEPRDRKLQAHGNDGERLTLIGWRDLMRAESESDVSARRWVVLEHPGGDVIDDARAWDHKEACRRLEMARCDRPDEWPCLGRIAPLTGVGGGKGPRGQACFGYGWGGVGPRSAQAQPHDVDEIRGIDAFMQDIEADAALASAMMSRECWSAELAMTRYRLHAWGMLEAVHCLVDDRDGGLIEALRMGALSVLRALEPEGARLHDELVLASSLLRLENSAPSPNGQPAPHRGERVR